MILNKIAQNQLIRLTGDVIIEGDMDKNAQIIVTDGSLTIDGSVKGGAFIAVRITEKHGKVPLYLQAIEKSAAPNIKSSKYCFNAGNTKIMSGNVNINNRIFSDDNVTDLGNECYKVTSVSAHPFSATFLSNNNYSTQSTNEMASVTVDNKTYHGKEILIDGAEVIVDGVRGITDVPKCSSKLIIKGNVADKVVIRSDADIEIMGTIGRECHIESDYEGLSAKHIGSTTFINVYKELIVESVDEYCTLKSQKDGVYVKKNVGEKVSIEAMKDISIDSHTPVSTLFKSTIGKVVRRAPESIPHPGIQAPSSNNGNPKKVKALMTVDNRDIDDRIFTHYIGEVNIDERIFTHCTAIDLGNQTYEIVPNSDQALHSLNYLSSFGLFKINTKKSITTQSVEATVDGISYEGKTIRIEGGTVFVDGIKQSVADKRSNSTVNFSNG